MIDAKNNETNVELGSEFTQRARKLIVFSSDRAKSENQNCIVFKNFVS